MHQVLINLGEAICQTLNAIRRKNNTAHSDPSNLLWIHNPVWSDIVGYTKAHELLIDHTGNPQDKPNYYHDKKSLIHAYFAPNTLTPELAGLLNTPEDQVDPAFLNESHEKPTHDVDVHDPNSEKWKITYNNNDDDMEAELDHDDDNVANDYK